MQATESPRPVRTCNPTAALALLLCINLFNYIDRQVLAAVEPEIRRELLAGVEANEAKESMGWLPFVFLISYMVTAPIFGQLANRYSRWFLVGIGVIIWSLASGGSGVPWEAVGASAFAALLMTRCFVGVGEGAYGPIAPAMLSDLYPVEKRGQMMAYFYLAIPVGGALGYTLGEILMRQFGWRYAFYAVVPPGILLGLWCFGMREPPRGQIHQSSPWQQYKKLLKIPSYVLNTLGMTAMTFAIGGLAYWMPAFLEEKNVPDIGPLGPRTFFGGITALSGLLATLAGGWCGDKLRNRFSGSYFLVSGIALMLGFPMVVAFVYTPFPFAWIFVFLAVFCLFFNTAPTNALLANVTDSSTRASAFALNILIIHLFGDAISPRVMASVARYFGQDMDFIFVSGIMLLGGVFWLLGMKYLERDTEAASAAM